ncbi:unnamed protein product [Linum tenue]|uniref:Uncharacterized protein n=1 Tax=Linum tenue TaxID=586396 RepID=A0AAV0H211_9ROSI|nr:unnamed protein product [Linum tenue]
MHIRQSVSSLLRRADFSYLVEHVAAQRNLNRVQSRRILPAPPGGVGSNSGRKKKERDGEQRERVRRRENDPFINSGSTKPDRDDVSYPRWNEKVVVEMPMPTDSVTLEVRSGNRVVGAATGGVFTEIEPC